MIAIPWYFAQKEMLSYFGFVYIVTNIIVLFWMPISGSIVDKYDRKKIFLVLTIIVGCTIGAVSYLGYSLGELPPLIVASVFMITFLNYNIHYPELERTLIINFQEKAPYIIESWSDQIGNKKPSTAKRITTKKLPYWQQNAKKFEALRNELGLE